MEPSLFQDFRKWREHQLAETESIFTLGVVRRVLHMLSSNVKTEIRTLSANEDLEKKVQEAKTIFSHICVSFQQKSKGFNNIEVRNAIRNLKRRAYETEDILDKAAANHLEGKGIHERSTDLNLGVRFIISDLQNICGVIMDIMPDKPCYILPVLLSSSTTSASPHYDRLLFSWEDQILIDRESEKQQLLDWIFHPSNKRRHPILISIRGDSGIGKTSLTKLIYNDVQVSTSFDLLLWASVQSTCSNLKDTIEEIIRSLIQQSWLYLQGTDMETLKHRLCHILKDHKYLLVLDDINFLDYQEWEELKKVLRVGSRGSTVIVTASSSQYRAHEIVGGANSLELKGLDKTGSWLLFSRCCKFDEEARQEYPFLSRFGREIVQKYNGNPLAIKTFGSMLRINRDEHIWKQISESMFSFCMQSMSLELVQCFSVYVILSVHKAWSRDELVYFWMAQGLLYSTEANDEDLRDIGHRYCNDLLSRSFIQSYQSDDQNRLFVNQAFQRILTSIKVQEIHRLGDFGYPSRIADNARHLICYAYRDLVGRDLDAQPNVRTFLFGRWVGHVEKDLLEGLISQLSHARVLLLDGSVFEELPESIGNLKLLRYLSLKGNHELQLLPETICNQLNLQTLDLSGCQKLTTFPKSMHKLANLRHLFLSVKLTHIQGEVLKSLRSLHHLKICHSPNLTSISEEIAYLTDLRVLQIHYCPFIASLPNNIKRLALLKELSIINCQMLDLEKWDGLYGLKVLQFLELQGLPMLINFPEGLLSAADSLQHLILHDCQHLTTLPETLHKYKSLLEIAIEDCSNITSLPNEIKAIETLQILKIVNCSHLIARCQSETGEDWPLISHIPKIHLQIIPNRATSTLKKHPDSRITQDGNFTLPGKNRLDEQEVDGNIVDSLTASTITQDGSLALPGKNRLDEQEVDVNDAECLTASTITQDQLSYSTKERDEDMVAEATLVEEMKNHRSILYLLPENYEIEKDTLIQLWMAGEYIKDEPMELTGEEFFSSVLTSGYLLHSGTNFMTGKERYLVNIKKINELLKHEKEIGISYLKWGNDYQANSTTNNSIQHVSLACDDIDATILHTLQQFTEMKTLLFLGDTFHSLRRLKHIPDQLFSSFESLHTLDLSKTHIRELPSSVGNMVHLRYLDLSETLIAMLPDIICSLVELQTLKLEGCMNLRKLPGQLKSLTSLRHLQVDVLIQLQAMPESLGALVNLRTLSAFLVGGQEGYKIRELKELNKLAGSLCIAKLENVENADEVDEVALYKKYELKKLELRWTASQLSGEHEDSDAILKSLRPCTSLEELQILCYEGLRFPSWVSDLEFKQLAHITFFDCIQVTELPPIEHLPSLKHLQLVKMTKIERIELEGNEERKIAFGRLEKVEIDEMQSLKVWKWEKRNDGDFERLTHVTISECPELQEFDLLPHLSSIKYLKITDCPELKSLSKVELPISLQVIVEDCPHIQMSMD